MTALSWLGVSLVGAFFYAVGGIAYWHAHPDRELKPRQTIELAVAFLLGLGTMWGWGEATTSDGAMVLTAVAMSIVCPLIGIGAVLFCEDEEVPAVAFLRALLWPLTILATAVSAPGILIALMSWRLAVVASKGPASLGRTLAAFNPEIRRARREEEIERRARHIAELEKELLG